MSDTFKKASVITKEILINVTPQETRVAILENGMLHDLYIERRRSKGLVGNVYKGKVVRVLPGMEAAFVEIGLEKAAFLHVSDVANSKNNYNDSLHITQVLREGQEVLVQVNLGNEPTKSGTGQDEAADLCRETARLKHVKIRGLMTMPPFFDEPEKARPYFAALSRLRDRIAALSIEGVFMEGLSMGMTGDFEAAVEEGATWVRIGTALFGERQ